MNIGRRQRSRDPAALLEEMGIPGRTSSQPERLGHVIRGLASDLVAERRRSNELEREVKELKAQLAAARRAAS
jgi:hypothetical protein